jgi:hypothetical protein
VSPRTVAPCVAVTLYADLAGTRSLAMVDRLARAAAPGDLAVTVHDPPSGDDAQLARAIRERGLRLWYAWGVDPDVARAPGEAEQITRTRAELARDRGAELVELNGEARWKSSTAQAERARALAQSMIAASRTSGLVVAWTSYDHVLWHRLPWHAIAGPDGVDLWSPQYYAADTSDPDPETHREARARLKRASDQLATLVQQGHVRADLGPGGAGWAPYGQVHGLTTAGAAVVLDAAPVTRAWALPTRCDEQGLRAIEAVLRARALTGHRGAGAIARAQALHGLTADGVVGPATLAALGVRT